MTMTLTEQIITIAICALGTMATRFLPFLLFSEKRKTPAYVQYLGRVLPAAVFGMLVVYCLKNVSFLTGTHGLPELIAIAATVALHLSRGEHAGFHRGRHGRLHAAGAACILGLTKVKNHLIIKIRQ